MRHTYKTLTHQVFGYNLEMLFYFSHIKYSIFEFIQHSGFFLDEMKADSSYDHSFVMACDQT